MRVKACYINGNMLPREKLYGAVHGWMMALVPCVEEGRALPENIEIQAQGLAEKCDLYQMGELGLPLTMEVYQEILDVRKECEREGAAVLEAAQRQGKSRIYLGMLICTTGKKEDQEECLPKGHAKPETESLQNAGFLTCLALGGAAVMIISGLFHWVMFGIPLFFYTISYTFLYAFGRNRMEYRKNS